MNNFYDGAKLLSLKDLNGQTPEIYICTSNRNGGKTTFFGRYFVNRYKKFGEKFCLLYRYNYELDDCSEKFFKDIGTLFFDGDVMDSKSRAKGIFHTLYLNEVECGYALSLNSADQIKKYSHLFSDVQRILFDEFQSETGHYCADEVKKFISVHTSIARGQGKQIRHVPVFMIGNPVSIINPYYVELGISTRLNSETRFLRGDGFVMEQGFNASASKAQLESPFNRAFSKNDYIAYSAQNVYLNDSKSFIDDPSGSNRYICTIKYGGSSYGIREYPELGVIYASDKWDESFRTKIVVNKDDHDVNYVMLKRNDLMLSTLRWYFERGCFRFKNIKCKEAVLKSLSY